MSRSELPAAPALVPTQPAVVTAGPPWLASLLAELIGSQRASAAVALVASPRRLLAQAAAGEAAPAAGRGEALFDLASLTKPWTTSLALRLDALGLLPLELAIGELWPGCDPQLAGRTLGDLLSHRAGLAAWTPLYRRCRRPESVPRLLLGGRLLGARRGTYSDLDYILWGFSAERAMGRDLAALLLEHVAGPLGLEPARRGRAFALPCRLDNGREVALAAAQGIRVARRPGPPPGRVQDGNARFLGGLPGHAGLFASAQAVAVLAQEWLRPHRLWSPGAAAAALAGAGRFALGWWRRTRRGSAGADLGRRSFGHVGFTGGSLWIDPERRRVLLLLAHRSTPGADLAAFRRRFHRRALATRTW